jgi:hypothetical protein
MVVLGFTMMTACAQPASVASYGYVRETLPGIPATDAGGAPGAKPGARLPPDYYIYIEVAKGRSVAANWIWLRGEYHRCSLQRTSAPVRVDVDEAVPTGEKETLVPATVNDVYRVAVGDLMGSAPPSGQGASPAAGSEAVVSLTIDKATSEVAIGLKRLKPRAGM